jgi:hypothetical protein
MTIDCNAGGHCGSNNWKHNSLCDNSQQAISVVVNEELICDSDGNVVKRSRMR